MPMAVSQGKQNISTHGPTFPKRLSGPFDQIIVYPERTTEQLLSGMDLSCTSSAQQEKNELKSCVILIA